MGLSPLRQGALSSQLRPCAKQLSVTPDCLARPPLAHPALASTWAGRAHQGHELQPLQQLAVPVLQPMGLVNDHAAPLDLLQLWAVSKDHLEGGDNHLELEDPRERVALGRHKMYAVLDCCRQQDTVKHPGGPHRLATMAVLESGSWL